ncbi:probable 39S ribosomal protein L49, mitochondrial [Galendromus occidentalis]|uniref:Large ribosomal subunit protein mL49 n=1 Tax=Galendromus occidentalis TaxID=34638 RepID=A0AAJ6VYH9_9ACAR|nr:probable 39S ribosomal protein L49, mitochondrial [Galendromus occidentalis]
MLRRVALPFLGRAGQRLSSTDIPEKHLDKFDVDNPNYTKFEVVSDPDVWSHVERLMPKKIVPPSPTEGGPSGWTPVRLTREEARELPYFVQRTRNHMLPVYQRVDIRGPRYVTVVRKVQGDPWALRNALKEHIKQIRGTDDVTTMVNELTQTVGIKGQLVEEVKDFLIMKGF